MNTRTKLRAAAAATLVATTMVVAPMVANAAPVQPSDHQVSHLSGSSVANNLDSKLTIVNETAQKVAVRAGHGASADTPDHFSVLDKGDSFSEQGYYAFGSWDVQAKVDFSGSNTSSSVDKFGVEAGNPVIGSPIMQVSDFDAKGELVEVCKKSLSVNDSYVATVTTQAGAVHQVRFERHNDLPDAKDLVAYIVS